MKNIKSVVKGFVPTSFLSFYYELHYSYRKDKTYFLRKHKLYHFLRKAIKDRDLDSIVAFLSEKSMNASFYEKLSIVRRIEQISYCISCPHTQHEMLSVIRTILSVPQDIQGCVVEAGSYKGGSAAKFSIACKMMNRRLMVFDSFEGIPENRERDPYGELYHQPGIWCGLLDEVRSKIMRFGELEVCQFIKGWFDNTMPKFNKKIVVIYLDVDLASSTRTCLKYLYPLLVPGGILYSQDGHLPLVIDVFNDDEFWAREVGYQKPHIKGLGKQKLIKIVKPIDEH